MSTITRLKHPLGRRAHYSFGIRGSFGVFGFGILGILGFRGSFGSLGNLTCILRPSGNSSSRTTRIPVHSRTLDCTMFRNGRTVCCAPPTWGRRSMLQRPSAQQLAALLPVPCRLTPVTLACDDGAHQDPFPLALASVQTGYFDNTCPCGLPWDTETRRCRPPFHSEPFRPAPARIAHPSEARTR